MAVYPNSEDYVRAVQRPDLAFRPPALRRAVFEVHPLFGIPMPASGNAAVVFKAAVDGTDHALRFFVREDASSGERYTALGRHFIDRGLVDCVATTAWVDDAIEIKGRTWPMMQMEWIDGRTLDAYVGHLAERSDVGALHQLAGAWRQHLRRLQDAEYAHGDLQHGNVLVDNRSALRLVDFDGSWIAAFHGGPPPKETGHPNYQRTGRTWGRWMDSFPGLVIYTGLLALSRRPDAWKELHNGENILFSHDDFAPPFSTRAWRLLGGIEDPEIEYVVGRLRACCDPRWTAHGSLEQLLARERTAVPAPPPPPPPPVDDPALPWWVKTGAATAGAGGRMPPPPPKSTPGPGPRPPFTGPHPGGAWYGHRPDAAPPPPWLPPQPPPAPPPMPPKQRGAGRLMLTSAGVALAAGLIVAIFAGRQAGPAFLVTATIAFLVALLVQAARRT